MDVPWNAAAEVAASSITMAPSGRSADSAVPSEPTLSSPDGASGRSSPASTPSLRAPSTWASSSSAAAQSSPAPAMTCTLHVSGTGRLGMPG